MESWRLLQPSRARAKQNCRQSIADKTATNQACVCIDLFINVLITQSSVAADGQSLKNLKGLGVLFVVFFFPYLCLFLSLPF